MHRSTILSALLPTLESKNTVNIFRLSIFSKFFKRNNNWSTRSEGEIYVVMYRSKLRSQAFCRKCNIEIDVNYNVLSERVIVYQHFLYSHTPCTRKTLVGDDDWRAKSPFARFLLENYAVSSSVSRMSTALVKTASNYSVRNKSIWYWKISRSYF